MIFVDRSSQPVPSTLKGAASAGSIETAKNAKLAAAGKHDAMDFAAYSTQPVKDALGKLFHRKCAYCESLLLGNQPGDVEHYRPKKKVRLEPKSGKTQEVAGYYWLAAEWTNLLSSCADCNRPRKQEINGAGVEVKGKANWFPVKDEVRRAKDAKGIKREPRLLLDPCVDDPAAHISFHEDGSISARNGSAMGRATIIVCGLDRVELLQARAKQRRYAEGLIRNVLEKLDAKKAPSKQDIDDLLEYMDPSSPFSAFMKHVIGTRLGSRLPLLAKRAAAAQSRVR